MLSEFQKNLLSVHQPLSPDLSFDEFVANCLSKCSFSVFMPLKWHPRGIRFYPVVDSDRLTVSLHMDTLEKFPSAHPEFGFIDNLTAGCLEPFLDKGYRVTLDQGFGNPTLLSWLLGRKTPACATMRPDRKGVPDQLKWATTEYKLNKSETKWVKQKVTPQNKPVDFVDGYQSGQLTVLRWQCKEGRALVFGTTIHNLELASYAIKRKFGGRWATIQVPKPICIAGY